MGRTTIRPRRRLKKSSGDRETTELDVRGVARPRDRGQTAEQRERLLREPCRQREAQVELVAVAGGDPLVKASDDRRVRGLVERRLPRSARGDAVHPRRQLHLARPGEDPEPQERRPVGVGGTGREAEGRGGLVGEEARNPAAGGERRVRPLERREHGARLPRFQHGLWPLEEQKALVVLHENGGILGSSHLVLADQWTGR
jgi:hypothetical protein